MLFNNISLSLSLAIFLSHRKKQSCPTKFFVFSNKYIFVFDMDTPAFILRHFLRWRFSRVFDRFLNDFHIYFCHFWWIDFILFVCRITFRYCYFRLFYIDMGNFAHSNLSRWMVNYTFQVCSLAHGKQVIEKFQVNSNWEPLTKRNDGLKQKSINSINDDDE